MKTNLHELIERAARASLGEIEREGMFIHKIALLRFDEVGEILDVDILPIIVDNSDPGVTPNSQVRAAITAATTQANREGYDTVVVIIDYWAAPDEAVSPPEKHPQRSEALIIGAVGRDGNSAYYIFRYQRNNSPDNRGWLLDRDVYASETNLSHPSVSTCFPESWSLASPQEGVN